MRHVLFVVVLASVPALSTGCALIHHLDEYRTADATNDPPTPAGEDGGGGGSTTDAGDASAGPSCRTNAECSAVGGGSPDGGAAPAVCVRATGRCAPLLSQDCLRVLGDYTNDDAVVVGTLLGGSATKALEDAAFLAAEEIAGAGALPKPNAQGGRPLVVVGCSASSNVLRATHHLVDDLHVPAIVGPVSGEDVIDATQQVSAKAGTLLMTPASLVSAISNLADDDLTWRAIPSDAQRAKLVIAQMNDLETLLRTTRGVTTVKLGIVHPNDALGTSARDAISGKLIINGRFIGDAANAANVSVDAHQVGDATQQNGIATKYATTFKPDLVFITSKDEIANVLVPLEQALAAARAVNRPYYVLTDAAKSDDLLEAIAAPTMSLDIKRRVRGVGVKPDTSSAPVLEAFRAAFSARYGSMPEAAPAALSYDAMYAIAYAIAAARDLPLSGASVARGLRRLGVGEAATVGPTPIRLVMQSLSSGKSVTLRGTFSLLSWDAAGDVAGGTAEVWCVGGASGVPAFGSSGVTMDVQTQVVGGAFVQCQ
jgi:branched-chain amino acid transport system substrate-binding protein